MKYFMILSMILISQWSTSMGYDYRDPSEIGNKISKAINENDVAFLYSLLKSDFVYVECDWSEKGKSKIFDTLMANDTSIYLSKKAGSYLNERFDSLFLYFDVQVLQNRTFPIRVFAQKKDGIFQLEKADRTDCVD